jgi:hypothetical protein
MGIAHNDPLSIECVVEGGCIANLRIPPETPEATVQYLKKNSSFNKDIPFIVYGPVAWDANVAAFSCSGISLTDECTKEITMCSVAKVCEHSAYNRKILAIIEEFNEETKDNVEWQDWQRTYRGWDATNLETCGVEVGPDFMWVIKGHPVLELMTCGISIEIRDLVWHKIKRDLFKCCCQALRLRFDFLA